MGNYISSEEFLNQSVKVRKTLIEWWKPQRLDLINDGEIDNVISYVIGGEIHFRGRECGINANKYQVTVLLQMHQLIQFIEDKTKCKVNIEHGCGNQIYIDLSETIENECYTVSKRRYKFNNINLIESLWQVACEIAEVE